LALSTLSFSFFMLHPSCDLRTTDLVLLSSPSFFPSFPSGARERKTRLPFSPFDPLPPCQARNCMPLVEPFHLLLSLSFPPHPCGRAGRAHGSGASLLSLFRTPPLPQGCRRIRPAIQVSLPFPFFLSVRQIAGLTGAAPFFFLPLPTLASPARKEVWSAPFFLPPLLS